jgi:hypothetical protein
MYYLPFAPERRKPRKLIYVKNVEFEMSFSRFQKANSKTVVVVEIENTENRGSREPL